MKKTIYLHIKILVIIIAYYLFLYLLDITCLFKAVFKIPCPGCGSTRALLSLIKGDFQGYLYYHALSLLIVITIWIAFHQKLLKRWINEKAITVIIICNTSVIFIYYISRLLNGSLLKL